MQVSSERYAAAAPPAHHLEPSLVDAPSHSSFPSTKPRQQHDAGNEHSSVHCESNNGDLILHDVVEVGVGIQKHESSLTVSPSFPSDDKKLQYTLRSNPKRSRRFFDPDYTLELASASGVSMLSGGSTGGGGGGGGSASPSSSSSSSSSRNVSSPPPLPPHHASIIVHLDHRSSSFLNNSNSNSNTTDPSASGNNKKNAHSDHHFKSLSTLDTRGVTSSNPSSAAPIALAPPVSASITSPAVVTASATLKKPNSLFSEKARACTECGKQFPSWKALFGHMRCHPERQWRGIQPPASVSIQKLQKVPSSDKYSTTATAALNNIPSIGIQRPRPGHQSTKSNRRRSTTAANSSYHHSPSTTVAAVASYVNWDSDSDNSGGRGRGHDHAATARQLASMQDSDTESIEAAYISGREPVHEDHSNQKAGVSGIRQPQWPQTFHSLEFDLNLSSAQSADCIPIHSKEREDSTNTEKDPDQQSYLDERDMADCLVMLAFAGAKGEVEIKGGAPPLLDSDNSSSDQKGDTGKGERLDAVAGILEYSSRYSSAGVRGGGDSTACGVEVRKMKRKKKLMMMSDGNHSNKKYMDQKSFLFLAKYSSSSSSSSSTLADEMRMKEGEGRRRTGGGTGAASTMNWAGICEGSRMAKMSGAKFQCSTCKKTFRSHQALGGHRASHKRVKGCFARTNIIIGEGGGGESDHQHPPPHHPHLQQKYNSDDLSIHITNGTAAAPPPPPPSHQTWVGVAAAMAAPLHMMPPLGLSSNHHRHHHMINGREFTVGQHYQQQELLQPPPPALTMTMTMTSFEPAAEEDGGGISSTMNHNMITHMIDVAKPDEDERDGTVPNIVPGDGDGDGDGDDDDDDDDDEEEEEEEEEEEGGGTEDADDVAMALGHFLQCSSTGYDNRMNHPHHQQLREGSVLPEMDKSLGQESCSATFGTRDKVGVVELLLQKKKKKKMKMKGKKPAATEVMLLQKQLCMKKLISSSCSNNSSNNNNNSNIPPSAANNSGISSLSSASIMLSPAINAGSGNHQNSATHGANITLKLHECTICHRVFSTGQALGGHKRCHWGGSLSNSSANATIATTTTSTNTNSALLFLTAAPAEHQSSTLLGHGLKSGKPMLTFNHHVPATNNTSATMVTTDVVMNDDDHHHVVDNVTNMNPVELGAQYEAMPSTNTTASATISTGLGMSVTVGINNKNTIINDHPHQSSPSSCSSSSPSQSIGVTNNNIIANSNTVTNSCSKETLYLMNNTMKQYSSCSSIPCHVTCEHADQMIRSCSLAPGALNSTTVISSSARTSNVLSASMKDHSINELIMQAHEDSNNTMMMNNDEHVDQKKTKMMMMRTTINPDSGELYRDDDQASEHQYHRHHVDHSDVEQHDLLDLNLPAAPNYSANLHINIISSASTHVHSINPTTTKLQSIKENTTTTDRFPFLGVPPSSSSSKLTNCEMGGDTPATSGFSNS